MGSEWGFNRDLMGISWDFMGFWWGFDGISRGFNGISWKFTIQLNRHSELENGRWL